MSGNIPRTTKTVNTIVVYTNTAFIMIQLKYQNQTYLNPL